VERNCFGAVVLSNGSNSENVTGSQKLRNGNVLQIDVR